MKKRKIYIENRTRETFVVRRYQTARKVFCFECQNETSWLTPEELVSVTGHGVRKIFRMTETGLVHSTETADGFLLVCLESLLLKISEENNK